VDRAFKSLGAVRSDSRVFGGAGDLVGEVWGLRGGREDRIHFDKLDAPPDSPSHLPYPPYATCAARRVRVRYTIRAAYDTYPVRYTIRAIYDTCVCVIRYVRYTIQLDRRA